MHLTFFENVLWAFGTALKVVLCIAVFYRRLHKLLPFFSGYVALLVIEVAVVWSVYRVWGYTSGAAWYTYWCSVGIVLMARCAVIAELCWVSLRNYPAVWSLVRKVLAVLTVLVLGYAVISTYQTKVSVAAFVLSAESASEIAILVVLAALLVLASRYNVPLGPMERCIALGLAVFSAVQVVNDSFMERWMTQHFHWWNSTRVIAFDVALVIWLVPLRRPLPAQRGTPELLSQDGAKSLLLQLLERMRDMTETLKRIGKSK
jgi:hypothetical protein